jgi:hypothetical protein
MTGRVNKYSVKKLDAYFDPLVILMKEESLRPADERLREAFRLLESKE